MSKVAEIAADIQAYTEAGFIPQPTMTFTYRDVYGSRLFYPACEKGKTLCDLMGRKTLSKDVFPYVERMGFEIKVISREVR